MNTNTKFQYQMATTVKKSLTFLLFYLLTTSFVWAQNQGSLIVNVAPVQEILPPKVGDYKANPGKYFTVSIINRTSEEIQTYLTVQIMQTLQKDGTTPANLSLSSPPTRMPGSPIVVPANGTVDLTMEQMRRIFDHIPLSEMQFSADLFSSFGAADFGLLPEGYYKALLTAYKWDPLLLNRGTGFVENPVALSDPTTTGVAPFRVCYRAQAPQFVAPTTTLGTAKVYDLEAIEFPLMNPVFAWSEPVINCWREMMPMYQYTLTVHEVLRSGEIKQSPDEALRNPYIFQVRGISAPQCILDYSAIKKLQDGHLYVAQVKATPIGLDELNFAMVENDGCSQVLIFTPQMTGGTDDLDDDTEETSDEEDDDDEDEEDDEELTMTGIETEIGEDDALYVFRNPQLSIEFGGNTNNTLFAGNTIYSEWKRPLHAGGKGERPDTLSFRYKVQVFNLSGYATRESALEEDPIYEGWAKGGESSSSTTDDTDIDTGTDTGVDVLKDFIEWATFEGNIEVGQALMLRVVPETVGMADVRFYGEVNEVKFMFSDKLSEAFGNTCAGGVIQEKRRPWDISEKEMAGKEIFVGEYTMTMNDDVKQDEKSKGWSGTGWILWTPFGQKVKIGVKFENIFINEDRVMYDGVVNTETKSNWQHIKDRAKAYADKYTDTSELDDWIPDDIFTEWGLDNLVGYALPKELQGSVGNYARNEANSLAKKIKASKYYDYIRKGYAIYDNFQKKGLGGLPDIEVFLPLQISDVKKNPVDIQILSMEFHPTLAWMNLMGMYTLPDNDITDDNILIFGAPKTCMDPDRVLPGTGIIMLMSDVTLNDPNSSFDFTFRAPEDFKDPQDGCYIKWDNDTLSALSMHAEMSIPQLIKCDESGNVLTDQKPKVEVKAWINTWEDWMGSVSIDPFTHEDVKGWVFTAQEIVYDHSQKKNPGSIEFPIDQGYNKEDAGITNKENLTWEGLFINKLGVKLPKGLVGDSEISLSVKNMLVDVSGVSLTFNVDKLLDVTYGGWNMKLDKIFMNIVQNNFKDCGFRGSMHVPLMKGDMAFKCDFYPFEREDGSTDFDCILKCTDKKQLDNISFDFFLAELKLDHQQSYFLLESRADRASADGKRDTRVELCLGGDISIGGSGEPNKWIDDKLKDLPIKLQIPGIHFTQMRIANCKRWIADETLKGGKDIAEMQKDAENAANQKKTSLYEICKNNTYEFSKDFYFDRGWWSVASLEKKIGPFQFGITGYEMLADITKKTTGLKITGRIALMDKGGTTYDNKKIEENSLISVETTINIDCTVDVKNKEFKYKGTRFEDIKLNANFCDVKLEGTLKVDSTSKGYGGNIKVEFPGNLLNFKADGGFYEHSEGYKWGYVYAAVGGKMGVEITPLKITEIGAGIYFNCHASETDENKPTPQKGLIGAMADLGLSSSDGEVFKGDFHMSVLYDKSANDGKGRLTTFLFTGDCKAVGDIIKAKTTIKWENNSQDKYFHLSATVDASADGRTILNALGETVGAAEIAEQMKLLNEKYEKAVGKIPTGTLAKAMQDDSKNKADENTNANMKDVDEAEDKGPSMSAHASLDLKMTFREKGKDLPKCMWHVYLGEPEEKKRCNFTLIDFKSKIVSVKINGNFYFCVGNELPNNGQLPEIPQKIRDFLNGQSKGGMEGADMSKANNARKKALRMFNEDSEINGGVMTGASLYGYVDVELGIFYGNMGAIAGFDVTLAQLKYDDCPGYGTMGYNKWYGEGQLYAYLWANFGIHVNLGFWNKDFDIINAGIGGVLKAGLPHPSYFVGDARVKMKLLGGLVNINRRFQFECGHVCNIWYGNPLDNFELFGDCTIGSTNVKEGWAKNAELVNPSLLTRPVYYTQAPMGEHFRVLDENELHRMAENYEGDMADLEMQAKRTFVFRQSMAFTNWSDSPMPVLLEFRTMPDIGEMPSVSDTEKRHDLFRRLFNSAGTQHYLDQKSIGQTSFRLTNLNRLLNPNRYYCLVVTGSAKEIIKGYEENPKEYNENTKKYEQKEWKQTQFYFFRTGDANPQVDDVSDLEPYVALAYPSNNGELKKGLKDDIVDKIDGAQVGDAPDYIEVYLEDAQRPNIALTQQLWSWTDGKQNVKEGYPLQNSNNLYWVFKKSDGSYQYRNRHIYYSSNSQNITLNADRAFDVKVGDAGTLSLVYKFFEYSTRTEKVLTGYRTVYPKTGSGRVSALNQNGNKGIDKESVLNQNSGIDLKTVSNRKTGIGEEVNLKKVQNVGREKGDLEAQTVPVYETKTVIDSVAKYKVLMALPIIVATQNTWKMGYNERKQLSYSKPFVGIRLSDLQFDYNWPQGNAASDESIRDNTDFRLYDPYWYLSYLANYFFIGGHRITNYAFETMETPVSESLIYYTKGGQTSGNIKSNSHYNISNGVQKIYDLSRYNYAQYNPVFGKYPLPPHKDITWTPLLATSPRASYYRLSSDKKVRADNLLGDISDIYYLAEAASKMFVNMRERTQWWESPPAWQPIWSDTPVKAQTFKETLQNLNNIHRSVYKSVTYSRMNLIGKDYFMAYSRDTVSIRIPWYQFPLVFGGTFNHGNKDTKYFALHESVPSLDKDGNNRKHMNESTQMFFRMAGGGTANYTNNSNYTGISNVWITWFSNTGKGSNGKSWNLETFDARKALKHIKQVDYTIYRVNSYDWDTGLYKIDTRVGSDNEERVTLDYPFGK